jgi:hypothetical protein
MPEEPQTPQDQVPEPIDTTSQSTDFDLEGSSTTGPDVVPETPVTAPVESPFGSPAPSPFGAPLTTDTPVTGSLGSASAFPTTPVVPAAPDKKPRKKGLIIGIVVAAALALIGGSGALAYNVWYSNPQKVITDAIFNAVTAKTAVFTGSVSIDSDTTKVAVEITAHGAEKSGDLSAKLKVTYAGKDFSIDAAAVYADSGDIYLKAENLGDVSAYIKEQFAGTSAATKLNAAVDKLVAKVDGTWIKIGSDDLKLYSESYSKTQTCINDALTKFGSDSAATSDLSALYQANQFILIKKDLGSKDGSIGYELGTDKDKAKSFVAGLDKTKIYTALHDCDDSFTLSADDLSTESTSSATGTVEVWIDAWSHQFTKVNLTVTSEGTKAIVTLLPTFGTPVTVAVPSSSTTFTQLQADLTDIYTDAVSSLN